MNPASSEIRSENDLPVKTEVKTENTGEDEIPPAGNETASFGVWIPYWNTETVSEEYDRMQDTIDTVCFFAAYFDKEKNLFVPEKTEQQIEQLRSQGKLDGKETYLTFVNDLLLEKGSSLKDTDLLYELLQDQGDARRHAERIVQMTAELGLDGVEIDYERIRDDRTLWGYFLSFESELYGLCRSQSLKLRIVLEPSTPDSGLEWPAGPEYVMMCYNLCGNGTKPGPKADPAFLKKLASKMDKLPGPANMAIATGAFDFVDGGDARQLNYCDVVDLIKLHGGNPVRDTGSGDMIYQYSDDAGDHEVWYADSDTLNLWMDTIRSAGHHRISFWRLGGNL
ncbi:MAG: glycosyl hydrolase [Lachnospiraceae bacterium]|nr:glycosyl hydrolase [Lachnospiraceae bacterium]